MQINTLQPCGVAGGSFPAHSRAVVVCQILEFRCSRWSRIQVVSWIVGQQRGSRSLAPSPFGTRPQHCAHTGVSVAFEDDH